ncbi:MAG TPA: Fpg/Nei family DNA glycosylase [Bacteroidetes bacterium]|nr:Fpg/Nei family DNA glycosylase [Bacteroidota bacterium]
MGFTNTLNLAMPELPDLEVIKRVLNHRIVDKKIEKVEILQPLVFRCTFDQFVNQLQSHSITQVNRRGKFLIFDFDTDAHVVIHPMLGGRLQLCQINERLKKRTCFRWQFLDGTEFRYFDDNFMGRIYLVQGNDFSPIPQFADLGPEPLDANLSLQLFQQRLKHHPGMIKNILTNQKFLAGIGNAYADEILFAAGIHPFRKRPSLTTEEIEKLYHFTRSVLGKAIEILSQRMGEVIEVEIRDFLKVHRRGGEPCPVCGTKISEVSPNKRITSFCRNCQK